MTNYEKIKFLLEMWVYKGVEVRANGRMYRIKDIDNLEERQPQIENIEYEITCIEPIPNPPKLLPVGTKVRVFEEYAKICEDVDSESVYTICNQVKLVCSSYDIRVVWWDLSFIEDVPARAVVPVLD